MVRTVEPEVARASKDLLAQGLDVLLPSGRRGRGVDRPARDPTTKYSTPIGTARSPDLNRMRHTGFRKPHGFRNTLMRDG